MAVSVLILTKNEEGMIGECLDFVAWADEVVVIDSESTDATREIAKKKGAKVVVHPFVDFADQRNFAAKLTKADWILYIDADERVSKGLAKEIRLIIDRASPVAAYRLRRKNFYFSKPWPYQDRLERLFKRQALIGWFGSVHETPRIKGTIGDLSQPLWHYTHRDITHMLEKTIEWSSFEAQLRFKAGHPPVTWWRLFRVAATAFFDSFVKQRGFQVGTTGLIESIYQAYSMFITYARLWELQQAEKSKR